MEEDNSSRVDLDSSTESDNEVDPRTTRAVISQKPGIIYLSRVPAGFNVSQTTTFFTEFGRVGRVFLQPDKNDQKMGKYNRVFSEGWIEFTSKKVAKFVAENLNNKPVGGKRRSKAYDELWNIKYLPSFKWIHLSERLAYEAAVKQQRLRTESSQVKREAEHFKNSVERKRKKSKKEKEKPQEEFEDKKSKQVFQFRQRETEAQIRKRKREEVVLAVKDNSDAKKKKTKKKDGTDSPVVSVKVKSKRKAKDKAAAGGRKHPEGVRSELLKSVFGGGGS